MRRRRNSTEQTAATDIDRNTSDVTRPEEWISGGLIEGAGTMISPGMRLAGLLTALCVASIPALAYAAAGASHAAPVPHISRVPAPIAAYAPIAVSAQPVSPPWMVAFATPVAALIEDDEECQEAARMRTDRRRFPWGWGFGWLYRYGVDKELERSAVNPFSHYLRSPLLSGLSDRRPCPRVLPVESDEDCALVTMRTGADKDITLEVPLPQLDARNTKQLRAALREKLGRTELVTLVTTDGEDYELQPGSVKEIEAKTCRD
jgi:hypothetical protein